MFGINNVLLHLCFDLISYLIPTRVHLSVWPVFCIATQLCDLDLPSDVPRSFNCQKDEQLYNACIALHKS